MKPIAAHDVEIDAIRSRFIRETEIALFIGLRFPERFPRIPAVRVGGGGFSRAFADQFWFDVLGLEPEEGSNE